MRDEVREDVGVKHHDDADDRTKSNRVPEDDAEDDAFVAQLIGGG